MLPCFVSSPPGCLLRTPFPHLSSRLRVRSASLLQHPWLVLTGIFTTPLSSHWPIMCYLASLIFLNDFTPPSETLSDSLLTKELRSIFIASSRPLLSFPAFFPFVHPNLQEPESSLPHRHDNLAVFPWPPPLLGGGLFLPIPAGPNPASPSGANS